MKSGGVKTDLTQNHTFFSELKATTTLAMPVIFSQIAGVSNGFVDTIMVGRLGTEALAAVSLGVSAFFPLLIFGMGLTFAVGPMVSQAFGAGEHEPIERSTRQGLWMGFIISLPIALIMWNFNLIWDFAGIDPQLQIEALKYLRLLIPGLIMFMMFGALRAFVESISQPRVITIILFSAVFLNTLLDWVLIYGKFGFPALGIEGTAIASSIVWSFDLLALIWVVKVHPKLKIYGIFKRLGRPDMTYFKKLFKLGWPISILHGLEAGLFGVAAIMMAKIGTSETAAHQIALQSAAITFMIPVGISIATSVRVGQKLGAKNPIGARLSGYAGIVLATVIMALTALIFLFIPEKVVGLYIDTTNPENADVIAFAVSYLGIAAFFQLSDGVQITTSGILRGMKDTTTPMIIGAFSYWGIGAVVGYYLAFYNGLDGIGLWWGLLTGLSVAAVLLFGRFLHRMNGMIREAEA